VPLREKRSGRYSRYPFAEMNVGDSFFVSQDRANNTRSAALNYAKRHPPLRFTSRVENGGRRLWRIEDRPLKAAAE